MSKLQIERQERTARGLYEEAYISWGASWDGDISETTKARYRIMAMDRIDEENAEVIAKAYEKGNQ